LTGVLYTAMAVLLPPHGVLLAEPPTAADHAAQTTPRRIGTVKLPDTLRAPFAHEVARRSSPTGQPPDESLPPLTTDTSFACLKWFPQGPGLTTNGDLNISPENATSGCVSALTPHPSNPNILYIGTVNGGVWRSDNATSN